MALHRILPPELSHPGRVRRPGSPLSTQTASHGPDPLESYGGDAVFYEMGREHLARYINLGFTILKIGEEGLVPLTNFTLVGSDRRGLRYIHNRLRKEGCTCQIVPPAEVGNLLPFLNQISDSWLAEKKGRKKGCSLGFFAERYLRHFPLTVVRKGEEILAFANLWPGADRQELAVDLMRHRPKAATGIMEFLFVEAMLWGQTQGFKRFSLAMAPLAGLGPRRRASNWHRVGAFTYRHGEYFYNFK